MRREARTRGLALKWFLTALIAGGRLHFLDPTIPRRSPPFPFDKEFAGSPVMANIPAGWRGPSF